MSHLTEKIFLASLFCIIALGFCSTGQARNNTREFPKPTGLVSDFAGVLSEAEIEELITLIEKANLSSGLDGRVVVVKVTPDWNFNEYIKDYGDYLQANNYLGKNGWIFYLSVSDHKFALTAQTDARKSITDAIRKEITYRVTNFLNEGELKAAIVAGINEIGKIHHVRKPENSLDRTPSNTLIFMGIAVILLTLTMRSRKMARSRNLHD